MISHKVVRYAALVLLAIVAVLFVLNTANTVLSYVPFTQQWHDRRALAKVPGLEADVSKLTREATGNDEIRQATDTYHTQTVIVREIASQAEIEARNAPDADTPLTDERASRLRRHDDSVCLSAPVKCTPLDAARRGPGAVPSDGPAG